MEVTEKLKQNGLEVYHVNERLAFGVTSNRTFFITPLVTCEILHNQRNSYARYVLIRESIISGKYKSIADLLTDMRLDVGVGISYRNMYKWELENIVNV